MGIKWLTGLVFDEVREDDFIADILAVHEARNLLSSMVKIVIFAIQTSGAGVRKGMSLRRRIYF